MLPLLITCEQCPQNYNECSFSLRVDGVSHQKVVLNQPASNGPGDRESNIACEVYNNIPVTEIRGHEKGFSLDEHSFQVFNFESKLTYDAFVDQKQITTAYLDDIS